MSKTIGVIAGIAVGCMLIVMLPLVFISSLFHAQYAGCANGGTQFQSSGVQVHVEGWSPEQLDNAAAIIGIGRARQVSDRDVTIALMTVMQESNMRMLSYGDLDSVNMFQQRPSAGWGTVSQLMDRTYAINKFFSALEAVGDRDSMPLWLAAATVQRPREDLREEYAKWQQEAEQLVQAATPGQPSSTPGQPQPLVRASSSARPSGCLAISDSANLAIVRIVQSQIGSTFVNDITDKTAGSTSLVSGDLFLQWAYRQVEIQIPPSSADQQAMPVPAITDPAQLQPGDAIYWHDGTARSGIYLGDNQIAEVSADNPVIRITRPEFKGLIVGRRFIDNQANFTARGWRPPIEGDLTVTSSFGYRIHPIYGSTIFHDGTDIGEDSGTPVYAACDGELTMSSWNGGYGNYVEIACATDAAITGYGHLSAFAEGNTVGKKVQSGTLIGYVGSTGNSTGPHLHFLLHLNGEPADPVQFLQSKGVRV